jgi:hypothetical protein
MKPLTNSLVYKDVFKKGINPDFKVACIFIVYQAYFFGIYANVIKCGLIE